MIICIIGAGHCGSNRLSLSLDHHSDVVAVSEIVGPNAQEPGHSGSQDFRNNSFWSRVAANYQGDFGGDFWTVHFVSLAKNFKLFCAEWGKQTKMLFLA
jgi:hypothetical protein